MLTIRLQRSGKKNKPEYRVVLADKTAAAQKKFTEILGAYNPHTKNLTIRSQERLNYWMDEQHVPLSATVQNLFITKEIIIGNKTKAFTIPKKEVVAEETPAEPVAAEPTAEPETPVEATAEAIAEEVPAEAPIESPTEIPAPEAAPVEAPAEVTAETPVETPSETAEAPSSEQA